MRKQLLGRQEDDLYLACTRQRVARRVHTISLRLPGRLAVVALFLCALPSRAQLSPGPLSKAHTSISGITQCSECHGIGKRGADLKCAACHTEIRDRVAAGRGFHSTVVPKGADGKACVTCHSEHNGADFKLIHWVPSFEKFDHSKTGYILEGKHAQLECRQCHKAQNITPTARPSIGVQDPNHTYLGLSRDCLSCHEDAHHGQLDKNCLSCHTMAGWKGAEKFSHAKTKYPLTGAHERLACQKCHRTLEGPLQFVKYTGIAFSDCVPCHRDPHAGKFQGACQQCHTTSSWRQVRGLAEFDHSKTRFPLAGKHQSLHCEDCHRQADFKFSTPHVLCQDCHTPDPHRGQFQAHKSAGACAECHNELAWKPSLFTVEMHAATRYPLEGRHGKVACAKCHIPRGTETVFVITETSCASCHEDVHRGQFSGPPHRNRCEDCHTLQSFQAVRFTLAQHQKTRFPLIQAHLAVPCDSCHKPEMTGTMHPPVKYLFEDRSCTACHADPHRGEFISRMEARRTDGTIPGCEACHSQTTWHQLSGFDHSTTRYPLAGAHRAVACAGCHRPANLETSLRNVDFRKAPTACQECHEDAHAGQFSADSQPPHCDGCHNLIKWRPSTFDHETRSSFSLKGAHEQVPCRLCHTLVRQVSGRKVVFYKPTPRECSKCHS